MYKFIASSMDMVHPLKQANTFPHTSIKTSKHYKQAGKINPISKY
jgi:hypothetical protein